MEKERIIKLVKYHRIIKTKYIKGNLFFISKTIFLLFLLFLYLVFFFRDKINIITNKNSLFNLSENNRIDSNGKNKDIYINNIMNITNIYYNQTKVCVCTPVKEENRYIREFVQHYEKYGVDKIFLYDNNDIEGEIIDNILKDYISKRFVEILNWRGQKSGMYEIMNHCYSNNYEKYDWLIFYEVDEFIHLYNYTNVKDFLTEKKFEECELIHLNLVCHTDNNLLYYENKSLVERFPEIAPRNKLGGRNLEIKSIIRGHIPKVKIINIHRGDPNLKECNGFGHQNSYYDIYAKEIDDKYYYIDHYYSKSTEEFIKKINKYDFLHNSKNYTIFRIRKYFSQSKITKLKIDMIENKTGLNLSEFRKIKDILYIPFDF